MKQKRNFVKPFLIFGYAFFGIIFCLANPAYSLPPGGCPSVDRAGITPGPNRNVLIGTEVFLDARIFETIVSADCESDSVDITDTAEVLSVHWEFLPAKGLVRVLTNEDTLSPNFKADALGPYWLKVTASVRFVPLLTGVVRTQSVTSQVLINARLSLVDLKIKAIEVTQAIQTAEGVATGMTSGAIPMIALKDTVVRVYPDITGPGILSEADVDGSLVLIREEDAQEFFPMPLTPGQQVVVEPLALEFLRSNLTSSLNFLIPANLARGTVTLRATINPSCRIPELTCDNNQRELRITFTPKRPLNLKEVDIRYKRGGLNLRVKASEFAAAADYLRRVFPVSGVNVEYHGEMVVTRSLTSSEDWACGIFTDDCLLEEIEDYTDCGNWECPGDWGPDPHFYGMLPLNTPTCDSSGGCVLGWGELNTAGAPEPTAAGLTDCPTTNVSGVCQKSPDEEIGGEIMAHELAHNYGRKHVKSGAGEPGPIDGDYLPPFSAGSIGEYGFDVKKRQVILPSAFDFMTYRWSDPAGVWIGPYTYMNLFDEFPSTLGVLIPPPDQNPPAAREFLQVSGFVLPTGEGRLRPMYRLMRNAEPTIPPPGHFSIELRDETDQLLNSVSFQPTPLSEGEEGHGMFRGYILWHADTTAVLLKRGNEELHRIAVSSHTPLVTITEPVAGPTPTTLPDEVTIKWDALDADNDPLTALVQYSKDGGQTWRTMGTRVHGANESSFDLSRQPGSTNAFLRVLVTDGVNTGISQVGPFTVPFKNPTAAIVPLTVAEFSAGEPVSLQAFAYSLEEGGLTEDNNVRWESDLDGFLGAGAALHTNQLSPGLHTITVKAQDSQGMIGTDQIAVQILPEIPELVQVALSVKAVNQVQNPVETTVSLADSSRNIMSFTPLSSTYPAGTQVRVEASKVITVGTSLLVFQGWKINGSTVGVLPVLFRKLDGNTDLVAQYAPCTFSINPHAVPPCGFPESFGKVDVLTSSGCPWTAVSNVPWITILSGNSGIGSGSVTYRVSQNKGTSSRTGTLTIAGQTFSVTQNGKGGCTVSISSTNQYFTYAAQNGGVNVTAGSGCNWTAVSNASWIKITSGSSGTGSGKVIYSIDANQGASRLGAITIGGVTLTVYQSMGRR